MKLEIEFDKDEVDCASGWHGGDSTMFYAVASTGKLALGSRRPYRINTDTEWFAYLCDTFEAEILDALCIIDEASAKVDDAEKIEELAKDYITLKDMLAKTKEARRAVADPS